MGKRRYTKILQYNVRKPLTHSITLFIYFPTCRILLFCVCLLDHPSGRKITIFAIANCSHCLRLKAALAATAIPYTEIDLTFNSAACILLFEVLASIQERQKEETDVSSLPFTTTKSYNSVPQVFFNQVHIGGADDTLAYLNDPAAHGAYHRAMAAEPEEEDTKTTTTTDPRLLALLQLPPLSDSTNNNSATPGTLSINNNSSNNTRRTVTFRFPVAAAAAAAAPDSCATSSSEPEAPPPPPTTTIQSWSVLEMTILLKHIVAHMIMVRRNRVVWQGPFTRHQNVFTGALLVTALRSYFAATKTTNMEDESTAVEWCQELLRQQLIRPVLLRESKQPTRTSATSTKQPELEESARYWFLFDNSPLSWYRLQCDHTPAVLNSFCIWSLDGDPDGADQCNKSLLPDGMAVVTRLQLLLSQVLSLVTDATTGRIDYKDAVQLSEYAVFEEAACELQRVDLFAMDDNDENTNEMHSTRTAFIINVYNLAVSYAFCKVGIPTTSRTRGAFFNTVSMQISGHVFTLNELEHGILRGNRPPPYSWSTPFGRQDPRLALTGRRPMDNRIHFALNCGASSCPPVRCYSASALNEELDLAARSFCEQDANLRIADPKNGSRSMTLYLSKIFYWYQGDFAPTRSQLPAALVPFLRGPKQQALLDNATAKDINIKFTTYDWSTNASKFVHFDPATLTETSFWNGFAW